jgi:DNA-binding NtrC family response regulator
MRRVLTDILADDGWDVAAVSSGEEVLEMVGTKGERFDAIILDLSLPGMNGLEVIERLRTLNCEAGLLVMTAYGNVDIAVRAMQMGAADFLPKPFDNARLRAALRKIRESRGLLDAVERCHPTLMGADNLPLLIVGADPRLADILRIIKQIASLKASVLIHGESGTGKELVAQAIHYNGARRHHPFVPINCAALPETLLESEFFGHERGAYTGAHAMVRGKFELADHGTLFLDEVGDMALSLQVKLLRVLQDQRFTRVGGEKEINVDVRVIAATNRDLEDAIRTKQFREDLYYRLNVIPIHLPALRERREDIPQLADHFMTRFAKRHNLPRLKLNEAQVAMLQDYHWPGNIRELQNSIEKATVLQDVGTLMAVVRGGERSAPAGGGPPVPAVGGPGNLRPLREHEYLLALGEEGGIRDLGEVAAEAQRAAVIRALRLCKGNKSEAAKRLGISYKTLFNKIDDLDIRISTEVN